MASFRTLLYTHRQAVMNTIGVSLIFSTALGNMKVKAELDSRLDAENATRNDLERFRGVLDEAWLKETEALVKAGKATLRQEVLKRVQLQSMKEGKIPGDKKEPAIF